MKIGTVALSLHGIMGKMRADRYERMRFVACGKCLRSTFQLCATACKKISWLSDKSAQKPVEEKKQCSLCGLCCVRFIVCHHAWYTKTMRDRRNVSFPFPEHWRRFVRHQNPGAWISSSVSISWRAFNSFSWNFGFLLEGPSLAMAESGEQTDFLPVVSDKNVDGSSKATQTKRTRVFISHIASTS